MKILSSISDSIRKISLPPYCTTWRGRRVTLIALGCLSMALIAYLFKKVTREQPKTPPITPASPFPEGDPVFPTTPPVSPFPEGDGTSYSTPVRTPSPDGFFENMIPYLTPRRTNPALTPHAIIHEKHISHAGGKKVLSKCFVSENQIPIAISETQFSYKPQDKPDTLLSLNAIFTPLSCIYINNVLTPLQNLGRQFQGWEFPALAQKKIMDVLSHLNNISRTTIDTLYPTNPITLPLLTHGPIHCSISKNEAGVISLTLNNVMYNEGNVTYQLYLILDESINETWDVTAFCTVLAQKPTNPLTFEVNECSSLQQALIKDRFVSYSDEVVFPDCASDARNLAQISQHLLLSLPDDIDKTSLTLAPEDSTLTESTVLLIFKNSSNSVLVEIKACYTAIGNTLEFSEGYVFEWRAKVKGEHPLLTLLNSNTNTSIMSHVFG